MYSKFHKIGNTKIKLILIRLEIIKDGIFEMGRTLFTREGEERSIWMCPSRDKNLLNLTKKS